MERSMTMPPATPSRPLPQPSPSRFSQYTVEEPEDEEANRSFESASESSAVSTAPSANSHMSGAGNGPGILDLRGNLPQPPKTGRAAASISALPKATHGGGGSRFEERQTPLPPPMDRAAATTGVIHEGGSGSMTLRFAKMGLDGAGNGAPWPQDLPPLPRGPGSGFTNSKPFSRPQSSHSQSSSSPRHSHSHSQPQSHSAFASVSPANAAPRGRTERIGPDYDLDEPPPRPASTSFRYASTSSQ
ncbi:hypothetical protein BT96DRAFT_218307 [Gymnopus androsaceus JB14]|uniref:Uncharacterized protein n=1 Tax=Gymnopus androsaceus JB14 TaxID=1447944 RepID=A0A6A4H5J3_9AGAR|nr:hypothetical protein BT96DRAFT_218307 [Gymnopus androsaceus JB14]